MSETNNAKKDSSELAVPTAFVHAYCFTHHNYTDETEAMYKALPCDYIIYGHEVCPKTSRKHLQGYLYWKNKKRGGALIKQLPGANLRTARGDTDSNHIYCSKEGVEIYERGTRPMDPGAKGNTQKVLWAEIARLADAGDFATLRRDYPQIDTLHFNKLQARFIRGKMEEVKHLDGELQGVWVYGPPGSGKSSYVYEMFGDDVYPKIGKTKWWCSYMFQKNVWIDDYDPTIKNMDYYMKIWTDRWKFVAEYKGGSFMIRPEKVVVTSNFTIEECFPDPKICAAMKRRFPTIVYIDETGPTTPPVVLAPIFNPRKRTAEETFGVDI